jgi:phosphatidylserine/phosphatidylglycerophosphate/cardiolipin synthase-like enzyme
MHNKFLIFAKIIPNFKETVNPITGETVLIHREEFDTIKPYAIWTGSFNFSKNSSSSLENCVLIYDIEIAEAYYKEYGQIMALSEQLDWESEYIQPEWRIGS